MKHFIIITNRPKDPDLEITRRVQELLKLRQASCSVYADEIPKEEWKRILLREGDRTDAILVLGGDGTMLRAARDTADSQIPMLGINLGTLGYLTEVEKNGMEDAIDRLMAGSYQVEDRMMLCGQKQCTKRYHDHALRPSANVVFSDLCKWKIVKRISCGRHYHCDANWFNRV